MKSLIPWKKRDREKVNLRKDFDDFFGSFFSEPAFSIPKLFSEKNWYPNVDLSEGKRDIKKRKNPMNTTIVWKAHSDCIKGPSSCRLMSMSPRWMPNTKTAF